VGRRRAVRKSRPPWLAASTPRGCQPRPWWLPATATERTGDNYGEHCRQDARARGAAGLPGPPSPAARGSHGALDVRGGGAGSAGAVCWGGRSGDGEASTEAARAGGGARRSLAGVWEWAACAVPGSCRSVAGLAGRGGRRAAGDVGAVPLGVAASAGGQVVRMGPRLSEREARLQRQERRMQEARAEGLVP
jgi:hypothetical protein